MDRKEIQDLISDGENILWQGKPQFVHYVLGRLFSIEAVLSMVWIGFILSWFLAKYYRESRSYGYAVSLWEWGIIISFYFIITFIAWKHLGSVLAEIFAYGNVAYVVTNLGVYASGGVFRFYCKRCNFSDYRKALVTRGLFDFCFGTGNVACQTPVVWEYKGGTWTENIRAYEVVINNVKEFREVYDLVKSMEWNTYVNGVGCNAIQSDALQDDQKAEEWDWRQ